MTEQDYKVVLNAQGFSTTRGNHGLIFVHPINKGNMFTRSFVSYKEAFEHYKNYLRT